MQSRREDRREMNFENQNFVFFAKNSAIFAVIIFKSFRTNSMGKVKLKKQFYG
jgi:hypothetical protein